MEETSKVMTQLEILDRLEDIIRMVASGITHVRNYGDYLELLERDMRKMDVLISIQSYLLRLYKDLIEGAMEDIPNSASQSLDSKVACTLINNKETV